MNTKIKKKGFTLIELLVVVAIISLLSSIVFGSLNSARAKARDAQRISDIRQIRNALELYYSSFNKYPSSWNDIDNPHPSKFWANSSVSASWTENASFPSAMATYFSSLPVDPLNQVGWSGSNPAVYNYSYIYCGLNQYMIVYNLEKPSGQISPGAWCVTFYNYGYSNLPNQVSTGRMTVGP